MRTILVTGGAGFIGSCFVREWLRESVDGESRQVVNLDKLTYAGNLDSLDELVGDPRHVFVRGDIADAPLVARLLAEHRPEAILNLAAETHVDRSIDGPAPFVTTNVVGTQTLLDCALAYWRELPGERRERFRFLHVSTDEVYGSLGALGLFSETTPYAPNSPYSASKAAADHFVRAYHVTYGLPTLVTNCSNNYGPRQFPEKLAPLMILAAFEGRPLPVYGDGGHVRDWLYVEDHCRALRCVLESAAPGATYNIGGDCQRTNLDVVQRICDLVDELRPGLPHAPCRRLISFVADRPGHDRRYAIDAGKIARDLGWRPEVDFDEGLRQTVRWYLDYPEWSARIASGVYRGERLGLSWAST